MVSHTNDGRYLNLGSVNKAFIVIICGGLVFILTHQAAALYSTFQPSLLASNPPPINVLMLVLVAQTGQQKGSEVQKRGFGCVAANILYTQTQSPLPLLPLFLPEQCPTVPLPYTDQDKWVIYERLLRVAQHSSHIRPPLNGHISRVIIRLIKNSS